MRLSVRTLAQVTIVLILVGCSPAVAQTVTQAAGPTSILATVTTPTLVCSGVLEVIQSFYSLNDAGSYAESLALFTDNAILSIWAEGMNGHHFDEKDLAGKGQISPFLSNLGLRLTTGKTGDPVFSQDQLKAGGDQVTFYLRPDRLHPDGRPYNPYSITFIFDGCKIKSLTVIELISLGLGSALRRVTYHYWYPIGEIQAIRQLLGQDDLPVYVGDIVLEALYRPEKRQAPKPGKDHLSRRKER